jgi:hypothetical protein
MDGWILGRMERAGQFFFFLFLPPFGNRTIGAKKMHGTPLNKPVCTLQLRLHVRYNYNYNYNYTTRHYRRHYNYPTATTGGLSRDLEGWVPPGGDTTPLLEKTRVRCISHLVGGDKQVRVSFPWIHRDMMIGIIIIIIITVILRRASANPAMIMTTVTMGIDTRLYTVQEGYWPVIQYTDRSIIISIPPICQKPRYDRHSTFDHYPGSGGGMFGGGGMDRSPARHVSRLNRHTPRSTKSPPSKSPPPPGSLHVGSMGRGEKPRWGISQARHSSV